MTGWHLDDESARRYADGTAGQPFAASAEAHLTACADCRGLLVPLVDRVRVEAIWDVVAERVDAPRPGPVERALRRIGVGSDTARLLAATPSLRASWLLAV
ncbi:MAG: zf-HC2 domain-containing protein, partial [Sporichthya sp.]